MKQAIVLTTERDGSQRERCRLYVDPSTGEVVATHDDRLGHFVLNRPLYGPSGVEVRYLDGERFINMLPAAYSGAMLHVRLVDEDPPFDGE